MCQLAASIHYKHAFFTLTPLQLFLKKQPDAITSSSVPFHLRGYRCTFGKVLTLKMSEF
jgi:hypothetical protein